MIKKINVCSLVSREKVQLKSFNFDNLKRGQILIKILYSSICQTQLNEFVQKKDTSKFYPHIMGHEGSGIVIDIGPGVKKVKKNDNVVVTWLNCKGIDSGPQKFLDKNKNIINSSSFFTFSDHAIVSENRVLKLNKNTDMKIAPLLGCAIPTALGSVDKFKIKSKDKIAILGAGGVGITILIYLLYLKVKTITVFDIDKKKINFIKKNFPNIEIVNLLAKKYNKFDFVNSYDYALESAGSVNAMELAFDLIHNNGTAVIIGNDHHSSKITLNPFDFIKGKKLYGSWGGFIKVYDEKFKFYERVLKKKSYLFEKILNKEFDLKSIDKAFLQFKNKKVIRPLIKLN